MNGLRASVCALQARMQAMTAHDWYDKFQLAGGFVIGAILLYVFWGPALTWSMRLFQNGDFVLKRLIMDLAMASVASVAAMMPWMMLTNFCRDLVLGPRPKR